MSCNLISIGNPSSVSVFEYFGIPVSFILGWLFSQKHLFNSLSWCFIDYWCGIVDHFGSECYIRAKLIMR